MDLGSAGYLYRHGEDSRRSSEERIERMGLLVFLLVVFLIALVAGFGWRAGTRRRL